MSPTSIADEDFCEKESEDELVYTFDFDSFNLATGVQLSSVGTFAFDPDDGVLTRDNEALVTGNRKTTLRLKGGTKGRDYVVSNTITTNETPTQTKKKKFTLRIKS